MGSNDNLENLLRTGGLKAEPPDRKECEGLLRSAIDRLQDAHALALTALRLQGYRSDRRYLVFQCLTHTLGVGNVRVRLFALCHERHNLAEYEGYMDVALLAELAAAADALLLKVRKAMADAWPA